MTQNIYWACGEAEQFCWRVRKGRWTICFQKAMNEYSYKAGADWPASSVTQSRPHYIFKEPLSAPLQ